jgi:hypothetical protein
MHVAHVTADISVWIAVGCIWLLGVFTTVLFYVCTKNHGSKKARPQLLDTPVNENDEAEKVAEFRRPDPSHRVWGKSLKK